MRLRELGDRHRTTLLCIDSYDNGVPSGRFFHPYCSESQSFHSLTQLLTRMEQVLEEAAFPASYTDTRTFSDPPLPAPAPDGTFRPRQGETATFAVHILFRRNSSWQGSVSWLEGGREQSFRSVLELILLLDSALRAAA